jgi:hypothetical protein
MRTHYLCRTHFLKIFPVDYIFFIDDMMLSL